MVQNAPRGLQAVRWLTFSNGTSGASAGPIPPFSCLQITGLTPQADTVFLSGKQFDGTGTGIFAFSGPGPVATGAQGSCTMDYPCIAAYDNSTTPATGDTWVPKSGQWSLTKGNAGAASGFMVIGPIDTTQQTMWVMPLGAAQNIQIGKANYAIPTSSQNYVEIYSGTPGSETDTGNQLQAWNWFSPVSPGQWVVLGQINGNWYVLPSGGGTVAVVQVTTSNTAIAGGTTSVGQPVAANAQGLFDAQVQTLTGGTTSFQAGSPWTDSTSVWLALSNQPGGSTDANTPPTAIAGDGYVAFQLGTIDPGSGSRPLYIARQAWRGPLLAQAKFDTPSGTQKNFEVYAGVAGSEIDQGYTVAAWNYGAPIFDGGWAFLDWNGYGWYVVGWGADTVIAQLNGPAGGSLSTPAGQLVQPAGGCFDASVLYFAPGATNLTTSSPVSADDDIWLAIIDHPGNVSAGVFSSDAQTVGDWFVATSFGTMNPGGSAGSRPLYVARRGSQPVLAKASANVSQGSSCTFNVYSGTPGSETQLSGATVSAFALFGPVTSGAWAWLQNNGSGWYVVQPGAPAAQVISFTAGSLVTSTTASFSQSSYSAVCGTAPSGTITIYNPLNLAIPSGYVGWAIYNTTSGHWELFQVQRKARIVWGTINSSGTISVSGYSDGANPGSTITFNDPASMFTLPSSGSTKPICAIYRPDTDDYTVPGLGC